MARLKRNRKRPNSAPPIRCLPPGPRSLLSGPALRRVAISIANNHASLQLRDAPQDEWTAWARSLELQLWAFLRYAEDARSARTRAEWFEAVATHTQALLACLAPGPEEDLPVQHLFGALVSFGPFLLREGIDITGTPLANAAYFADLRDQIEFLHATARFGAAIEREQAGATGRRGRPSKVPRDALILDIARAYKWAFGRPPRPGWDAYDGERSGPFLSFAQGILHAASAALPEDAVRERERLALTPAEVLAPLERCGGHMRENPPK